MAISKRTIVILILAVAIWAVAIFVLIMNTKPKPQTTTSNVNVQNSNTQTNTQSSGQNTLNVQPGLEATAIQLFNSADLSLAEIENIIPESTFSDFLTPYKLNLKVSVSTSLFQGAIQEEDKQGTTSVQEIKSNSVEAVQQPSQQKAKPATSEVIKVNTSDITDVEEIYYVGYMSIQDGGKEIKRVYIQIGEETKSFLENELINGKYKILQVNPTFVIVLDTSNGRVKKIRQIE